VSASLSNEVEQAGARGRRRAERTEGKSPLSNEGPARALRGWGRRGGGTRAATLSGAVWTVLNWKGSAHFISREDRAPWAAQIPTAGQKADEG
jgi:hypothetical protein